MEQSEPSITCYLDWCNIEDDGVSLEINYTRGGQTSKDIAKMSESVQTKTCIIDW